MPELSKPQVLAILEIGDPVLLERARDLDRDEIGSAEVRDLIEDMAATLVYANGAGLAAPQIGQSLNLFLFKPAATREAAKTVAPRVAINPRVVTASENTDTDWEGCLSIPGYVGRVMRPARIEVEYLDRQGQPVGESLDGFAARVFLHELDHLQGVLYTMKAEHDRRSFCTVAQKARLEAQV